MAIQSVFFSFLAHSALEESDARATRGNSGVKRGEKAGVKGDKGGDAREITLMRLTGDREVGDRDIRHRVSRPPNVWEMRIHLCLIPFMCPKNSPSATRHLL